MLNQRYTDRPCLCTYVFMYYLEHTKILFDSNIHVSLYNAFVMLMKLKKSLVSVVLLSSRQCVNCMATNLDLILVEFH
jgi:hypothetical protein